MKAVARFKGTAIYEGHGLVVFMNGRYVPIEDAKISLFDTGFYNSHCVYDTTSAWNGYIFRLDDHLERFYRSLSVVQIRIPHDRADFKRIVIETVRRCNLREAYIQMIATRGEAVRPATPTEPTVIVYAVPYIWLAPPEKRDEGLRVKIASHRAMPAQCLDPKVKNFSRLNFTLASLEGRAATVDSVILLDVNGYVTEGPGFNVFIVRQGKLFTPAEGILEGITRDTVFELAAGLDARCIEASLTVADLYSADEMFLTSTAGGIIPIVEVDGRVLGSGKPGAISTSICNAYWQMRESGAHGTPIFPAEAAAGAIQEVERASD